MLDRCGLDSLDDLYADIPLELQLKDGYNFGPSMSEPEIKSLFYPLRSGAADTSLLGCGVYHHHTPSVVKNLLTRSEFLTSYTPYQAEISQGTLQYIFEYQSMMAELTGMEVSNASMYDGTTATAEAVMMAVAAAKKRNRVLLADTLNHVVVEVVKTYAHFHGIDIDMIPDDDGVMSREALTERLAAGDVAAVVVPQPNKYGIIEDFTDLADEVHAAKALLIMNCNASTLGVLKTPGEWGADIAAGDAQSLGVPVSYGGPGIGFLCTSKKLIRKMPGRIVGATTDAEGRRAFVLTLQAREQHIRREKATSNICSNQSLMALNVALYLSAMGAKGLREVNELSYSKAHYLADRLVKTGRFELAFPDRPFLNEFTVKVVDKDLTAALEGDTLFNYGYRIADNRYVFYIDETCDIEFLDIVIDDLENASIDDEENDSLFPFKLEKEEVEDE